MCAIFAGAFVDVSCRCMDVGECVAECMVTIEVWICIISEIVTLKVNIDNIIVPMSVCLLT